MRVNKTGEPSFYIGVYYEGNKVYIPAHMLEPTNITDL